MILLHQASQQTEGHEFYVSFPAEQSISLRRSVSRAVFICRLKTSPRIPSDIVGVKGSLLLVETSDRSEGKPRHHWTRGEGGLPAWQTMLACKNWEMGNAFEMGSA